MKLALCTHFLDGDIWKERLVDADSSIMEIEEYGSAGELLSSTSQYDAVVVAMRGVAGLQTVRSLREADMMRPLLWIADENEYALFSYRYQVTFFMLNTEDQEALRDALQRIKEEAA